MARTQRLHAAPTGLKTVLFGLVYHKHVAPPELVSRCAGRTGLMSRRTERPYQVDGADKLAQHSAVRCSAPEINGPVVQREFRSLLRETCNRAPSAPAGARASNGPRVVAGVSRGRSTESHEPGNTGRPHNSGRAELGRQNTTIGGLVPGAMTPIGRALGSDHRGRRVAALSGRTARIRRTRTRMSGGVGGGGRNPPADPIRHPGSHQNSGSLQSASSLPECEHRADNPESSEAADNQRT